MTSTPLAVMVFAPPPGYSDANAARAWLASPFMELLVNQLRRQDQDVEVVLECDAEVATYAECSALVSFNRTARSLSSFSDVPRSHRVLTLWEPPSVAPRLYSKRNCSWFGTRVAFSRTWASLTKGEACFWPQVVLESSHDFGHSPRLPQGVCVVSNKRSANSGSLYHLRRQVLTAGAATQIVNVYGRGWNSFRFEMRSASRSVAAALASGQLPSLVSALGAPWSSIPNWGGAVESTVNTMRNYEVAIVIENEPSYVSEKLFDAFAAGCIPVYVGPPLADYGIPENLAIQAPHNPASILKAVEDLLQSDLREWRTRIHNYLSGPDVEGWRPERVASDLASHILIASRSSIGEVK